MGECERERERGSVQVGEGECASERGRVCK